jgi:hypothetical protein
MTKSILMIAALSTVTIFPLMPLFQTPAIAMMPSSCSNANTEFSSELENSSPPRSADTIDKLTHLMWAIEGAILFLDLNCSEEENYAELRASFKNSHASTKKTCIQLAANESKCIGKRYRG